MPDFVDTAERIVDALLESNPGLASYVGDHRFDDRLPDLSTGAVAEQVTMLREAADALAGIDPDAFERRALAELGAHAQREGVVLWLEPLNRYEDHMVNRLEQAVELARAASSPAVQVVGDLYHMNIEEADLARAIRDAAPLLTHVQIGDSNRLQPGAGHLDFAAAFTALADIGYDGWLAMECGVDGDPHVVLPEVARFVRGHLAAL